MRDGDRPRPLAMALEARLSPWVVARGGCGSGGFGVLGTSRILSLRPVVGSVVDGRAGSWET